MAATPPNRFPARRRVAVGLGQIAEAALAAHDGDGRVGQAGEIARQVADVRPAAVFVAGEVAHVVQAVFDVPVIADQSEQFLGPGAVGTERGQVASHFDAAGAGFEDLALAFDAHRLATTIEVGATVPFGAGEIDDGAAAALDPAMALVGGFVPGRVAPADGPESPTRNESSFSRSCEASSH